MERRLQAYWGLPGGLGPELGLEQEERPVVELRVRLA